jgi:hypothetical protein
LKQNCQTRAVDLFFGHLIILLDLYKFKKMMRPGFAINFCGLLQWSCGATHILPDANQPAATALCGIGETII